MNAQIFEQVMKSSQRTSSRRQAVATLAGAVFGGVAVHAAGIAAASTGGKRRPGEPRHSGAKAATLRVPADGSPVMTPVLRTGRTYQLRAAGFWRIEDKLGVDAFAAFSLDDPATPIPTLDGARLGLSFDGGAPDDWRAYNPGHAYVRIVAGDGKAHSLRFFDPITRNNSGVVAVAIRRLVAVEEE